MTNKTAKEQRMLINEQKKTPFYFLNMCYQTLYILKQKKKKEKKRHIPWSKERWFIEMKP